MSQIVPLLASVTLALVYLLFLTDAAPSTLRSVVKTGAVALLAISALPVPLLALAFGLSALGDLALSRDGDRAFLAGVAAFALAHLAYVAVFLGLGVAPALAVEWRIGAGFGVATVSLIMARLLWPRSGPLRWPVLG